MKLRAIMLTLLLGTANVFAQAPESAPALSTKQWEPLLQALADENWVKAADSAGKYLKEVRQDDNEHSLAKLRYMFMFASAAKVAEGKMTYEELQSALNDFVGKEVMTPHTSLVSTCRSFNSICVKAEGNELSLVSSNAAGTYIYMFQYATLETKTDYSNLDQKSGAMRGTIAGIQFNPNKSTIWIMRVFLAKATLALGG